MNSGFNIVPGTASSAATVREPKYTEPEARAALPRALEAPGADSDRATISIVKYPRIVILTAMLRGVRPGCDPLDAKNAIPYRSTGDD